MTGTSCDSAWLLMYFCTRRMFGNPVRYRSNGRDEESIDRATKWLRWASSSSTAMTTGMASTRSS